MTVAPYPFRPVESAEDTTITRFSDFNDPLKGVTLEQIRALHNQVQAAALDNNQSILTTAASDEFVTRHPEYIDSDENARAMDFAIKRNGNDTTIAGFEQAFADLRAAKLIKVDEQKAIELQTAAARSRVRDDHGRYVANASLSEDDMYELDLDEVRNRANQQLARK